MKRALLLILMVALGSNAVADEWDPVKSTSDRFNEKSDGINEDLNESLNDALQTAKDNNPLQGVCGMDFSLSGNLGFDLPDLSCEKFLPEIGFSPSLQFSPSEPMMDTVQNGFSDASGSGDYFNNPSDDLDGTVIEGFE
ncbi:hypothetical protein EZI54_07250 [Marinobacter halodurans]|uniref:Uncharacterized protein n=1 Tax=Marinobacter halodurans TaxID=2528979 RepID=A0ABY1ZMG6_9GAMM|nr:hypothetical protein [Marinobacter halodurans]TBW57448.1 hypothetical protein EZI54_07250 [Marinobacter halodurans]